MQDINWQDVEDFDVHLDTMVADQYRDQPMAQDWARISKTAEEVGEAIQKFIGVTGQNPRKGMYSNMPAVLDELADVAFTAIYAIQHFTKDIRETRQILLDHQEKARMYITEAVNRK